jgi:murein DD-endopeptidase MepM/ murein hydrolase activator NlpD
MNNKKINIVFIATFFVAMSFAFLIVYKLKKSKKPPENIEPKHKKEESSLSQEEYSKYNFLKKTLNYQRDTIPNFRISSGFGNRIHPITKQKTFHNGIDIPAKEGTPIYAPMDGRVVIFNAGDGGKQLLLKNEKNKVQIGYAHLSGWKVKNGDLVKQGDLIAYSGNTGKSTGAHIHLTVKDLNTNEYINPELYIS